MSRLPTALADLPDPVFADLYESDEAYRLVIDIPGASSETLDVRMEETHLTIEARREKNLPMGFRYRREDRPVFFEASLPLPPDITENGVEASLERGTLTLTLPKRETSETQIPITTANETDSGEE